MKINSGYFNRACNNKGRGIRATNLGYCSDAIVKKHLNSIQLRWKLMVDSFCEAVFFIKNHNFW